MPKSKKQRYRRRKTIKHSKGGASQDVTIPHIVRQAVEAAQAKAEEEAANKYRDQIEKLTNKNKEMRYMLIECSRLMSDYSKMINDLNNKLNTN